DQGRCRARTGGGPCRRIHRHHRRPADLGRRGAGPHPPRAGDGRSMSTEALKAIGHMPCWNGALSVEPLAGGLSNESLLVSDGEGRYVVRFGRDFPFHHVSREREVMVARAAHDAGFAPRVVHSEPGAMVCEYVDASTCTAEDIRAAPERIAAFVREFHET